MSQCYCSKKDLYYNGCSIKLSGVCNTPPTEEDYFIPTRGEPTIIEIQPSPDLEPLPNDKLEDVALPRLTDNELLDLTEIEKKLTKLGKTLNRLSDQEIFDLRGDLEKLPQGALDKLMSKKFQSRLKNIKQLYGQWLDFYPKIIKAIDMYLRP